MLPQNLDAAQMQVLDSLRAQFHALTKQFA